MDGDRYILGGTNMKHIFFVLTFGSIYDRALPLIEEKKDKGEIVIVATTDQIEMFFKNYTDFKVIRTKVHPDLITRKTKHKILSNIIRSKLEFRKLFKDIENSEIYFCNTGHAVVMYSYIKKLSKRNKVIFYGKYPIEHNIKAFAMRWITKWLLGVETVIHNMMGVPFWQLDKKFFENIEILENYVGDKKLLDKYTVKLDIIEGKDVLILAQDLLVYDLVTQESFVESLDKLIDILDVEFPNLYVVKPHPREKKLYGKMTESKDIVPAYIPSELLMAHPWKFIISMVSTSLISASKITDAKVISMVDLFKWNGEKTHQQWKKAMAEGKIIIPKDFNEMKELIKGDKNR